MKYNNFLFKFFKWLLMAKNKAGSFDEHSSFDSEIGIVFFYSSLVLKYSFSAVNKLFDRLYGTRMMNFHS
jgi:hypothetical protein